MHQEDTFANNQFFEYTHRAIITTTRNSTLNPWTENELTNPFLNKKIQSKDQSQKKNKFKNLSQRKKMFSEDNSSLKKLASLGLKEVSDPNKILKQLPKLNIGHLIRDQSQKKKKLTYNSKGYIINSPNHYFSSPNLKKHGLLNYTSDGSKFSQVLPSVSRELNITRKIFLLENKLNGNSPSPNKKLFKDDSDIRRLVQKEWSKRT